MCTLQFLQLLHLADSALPVGAAAHSFGLEGLVAENNLEVRDLPDFFRGYLQEAGCLEAVFVYAGYDASSTERWRQLNQRLSAMKPARETREASLRHISRRRCRTLSRSSDSRASQARGVRSRLCAHLRG